ncbi:MAG: hypothetical protein LBQ66_14710 [Planctomycetaceae bacterium]|jgi:hypothetical protein|nr:hypothetical protein [Planctomycetaceae bacterium]
MPFFSDNYSTGFNDSELSISDKLQILVNNELDDDETIEWIGQPIPCLFSKKSLPQFLFAIPWTAFAIFWICGASGFKIPEFGPNLLFPLFGLPFVLIGLALLSSPFWFRRSMRQTVYAITNHRAIIFERGFFSFNIMSFEPEDLNNLHRKQKANGTGDIYFGSISANVPKQMEEFIATTGFFNIRNVKDVERKIRQLKESKKQSEE